MATTHLWVGKDKSYPYCIHNLGVQFKPFQYGNFIIVRQDEDGITPLYFGQGDLQEEIQELKDRFRLRRHKATHIHAHINPITENRKNELTDLQVAYPIANLNTVG